MLRKLEQRRRSKERAYLLGLLPIDDPAISPDGKLGLRTFEESSAKKHEFAGGKSASVEIYDVKSGEVVHTLRGHAGVVTAVTWGWDGTRIIVAAKPLRGGTSQIKLWDANGYRELISIEHCGRDIVRLMVTDDGTRLCAHEVNGHMAVYLGP